MKEITSIKTLSPLDTKRLYVVSAGNSQILKKPLSSVTDIYDVPARNTINPELPVSESSKRTYPLIEPVAVNCNSFTSVVSPSLTTTFVDIAFSSESFDDA